MSFLIRERLFRLSFGVALASSVFVSSGLRAEPVSITLHEAIRFAVMTGPDIAVAKRKLSIAHAARTGADVFPTNPAVNVQAGARLGAVDGLGIDGNASVNQALPLFGRWTAQQRATAAGVDVADADLWTEQTRVVQAVALAFFAAQRAMALRDIADKRIDLVKAIVATAERKLSAGDGTILDVNLWLAELGQAEAARSRLEATFVAARVRLAVLCGIEPSEAPAPMGRLGDDATVLKSTGVLGRADVHAQMQRVKAAKARTAWQARRAWPDVTVSASAGTEGAWWRGGPAGELIGGAGVSVPLPIFQRNQGAVERAKAEAEVARLSLIRTQRVATAEVVAAAAQLRAMQEAERTLKTRVLEKQEASLALLKKAHQAGTLGVTDVLLRQRSLIEAEAAYVNALADVSVAHLIHDVATGSLSAFVATFVVDSNDRGVAR